MQRQLLAALVLLGVSTTAACQNPDVRVEVRTVEPWGVRFELSAPAPTRGYIVQQITRVTSIIRCDGGASLNTRVVFWEAWRVHAGETGTCLKESVNQPFDDAFKGLAYPDTRGSIQILGLVRFFPDVALPPGMGFGVVRRLEAFQRRTSVRHSGTRRWPRVSTSRSSGTAVSGHRSDAS